MALSDYVHEIEMWLEEGRCLSARWISCQIGIASAAATSMLEEYKQSHPDVSSSFVVSGEGADGRYCMNVCTEQQLEATKSKFSKINSSRIYSLQKSAGAEVFNAVRTADYRQAKELLAASDTADHIMRNEYGTVQFSKLEISHNKKAHPTKAPRPAPSTVTPNKSVKDPAKPSTSTGSALSARAQSSAPSEESGIKEAVIKSKAVQNFFKKGADSASAPSAKSSSAPKAEAAAPASKTKPKAENVDDDGEWDDGSNYATDKSNLRKRKPAGATATFAEREEPEADLTDVAVDMEDPVAEESNGPNKFRVYGAMDNFIEDAAIAEHKKEVAAGNGDAANDRKPSAGSKRRKLVEKVFCDEKGYLVTEMVYEECDDNDADAQPVSEPVRKAPSNPPAPKPAAKSSSKTKDAGKGQKSMMSFFGGKK